MNPDETLWCLVSFFSCAYWVGDAVVLVASALYRSLKGA